jgi:hypothetical protein
MPLALPVVVTVTRTRRAPAGTHTHKRDGELEGNAFIAALAGGCGSTGRWSSGEVNLGGVPAADVCARGRRWMTLIRIRVARQAILGTSI